MKDKKYITVLDSEQNKVVRYELIEWFKNSEDAEQFLDDKGHNMTNCQWMETNGKVITFDLDNQTRYDMNNDGTREICG
jgi:hypothetical protein